MFIAVLVLFWMCCNVVATSLIYDSSPFRSSFNIRHEKIKLALSNSRPLDLKYS